MPNIALIAGSETVISIVATGRLALPSVHGYPAIVHKLESLVGGEALEDGRKATDHVVARAARLELTGWVSNFNGGDRPRQAWAEIRRLQQRSEPVAVLTEWAAYDEMIVKRAEAPQGRGMIFMLEFEEIIRVGVTDSDLPPGDVAGGPAEGRSGIVHRGRVPLVPPG